MRSYKSREDYFSLELPQPQTCFPIRTDIFQTKTTDILFCLISGDTQHSILQKVSYLFINKTKRLNKLKLTSLYTDVVLFFFSFFSSTSASENERGARVRKIKNFLLPHRPLTPSAGGQQIPRGFKICFLKRALDGL